MKIKTFILQVCVTVIVMLTSCRAPEKLSKKYYTQNETTLKQINALYNEIYDVNPFILGFTDAKFRNYSLELTTDTMRYVYNTSIMNFSVNDSILRFGLDSNRLSRLGKIMKKSRCICVARHFFYWKEKKYAANWLFFRQAKTGLFKERRYHVLIFFREDLPAGLPPEFISGEQLTLLKDHVYYTISNRFK